MDRALEHDARRVHGRARLVDRPHLAARDLPRHPPRPARAEQRELPALDADGLPRGDRGARRHLRSPRRHVRPRAHVQRRVPHLHHRVDPAVVDAVHRFAGRDLAHRFPRRAGRRRRAAPRQRDRDPHRRVPGDAARHGHGHQHGRRHRGPVRRPRRRRSARRHRLAPDLLGERARRRVRDGVGLPQAEGGRHATRGAHGLVGQRHVRPRPDPRAGRHHLRHPALRRSRDGLDQPDGARRAHRWPRAARGVRDDRTARRRADVQPAAVQDPRLPRRQRRQLHDLDRARRPAVHAHHLAAGHLAPAARLQLRRHAVVGRHLHAPADPRVPRRRSGVGLPVRPLRRALVRHHRDGRHRAELRPAHAAARRLRVPGVRGRCCS